MTRPHVIRADTIDLQDPDAPSAKDHTRQPARPGMLAEGTPAPHQAEALKHVEMELSEQHGRSPRASADLSGKELQLLHDESEANGYQDPSENLLRNSAQNAGQEDIDDGDGDDGLDDDLGDKISSSPSIGDDGGYPAPPLPWPPRRSSSSTPPKKASHSSGPPFDELSSSPFKETPTHYPISFSRSPKRTSVSSGHHQRGEYGDNRLSRVLVDEVDLEKRGSYSRNSSKESSMSGDYADAEEYVDTQLDPEDFQHLLLPDDDPLLIDDPDDGALNAEEYMDSSTASPASTASWDPDKSANAPDDFEDDDDSEYISYDPDSRFIDSGWGGECLRELEDIDFEFVYALHTFVATVEGQANATKGDTMVLLDDSNSYWWLVRVVKDSSIGYLPAEHIETPLERLARLNKHRNLDLSQTMLGDQDDDKRQNPLNPLRKAMRRRNVKKVEFSASNSFLEPDETQFSSDEEDEGDSELHGSEENRAEGQTREQERDMDHDAKVAPLSTRDRTVNGQADEAAIEPDVRNGADLSNGADPTRSSDDTFERNEDGTPGKSRKGTVRNTDSFFKDDSVETRKINLTPSLLRDDMGPTSQPVQDPTDLRLRGNSLDSLEKDPPPEYKKEDKKKKEKRGVLGGMFKRKDKKNKDKKEDVDEPEKTSSEIPRKSPTPKESMESLASNNPASPHRQSSKLQKQRPTNMSPKTSCNSQNQNAPRPMSAGQLAAGMGATTAEPNPKPSSAGSDMRLVLPESQPLFDKMPSPLQSKEQSPQDAAPAASIAAPDRNMTAVNQPPTASRAIPLDPRPEQTRQPQLRNRTDDADATTEQPMQRTVSHESQNRMYRTTSHESQERAQRVPSHESQQSQAQRTISHELQEGHRRLDPQSADPDHHLALAQAAQHEPHPQPSREHLSDSPVQVSPPRAQEQNAPHQPPPLVTDTSSPSPESPSPVSPPSSPELMEAPSSSAALKSDPSTSTPQRSIPQPSSATTPTAPSKINTDLTDSPASTAATAASNRSLPAWSDASLRSYMEDDSEIRDLLIIVHDKTGVVPRKDHPVVKTLFKDENERLKEIEGRLDGLLGQFYERRGRKVKG